MCHARKSPGMSRVYLNPRNGGCQLQIERVFCGHVLRGAIVDHSCCVAVSGIDRALERKKSWAARSPCGPLGAVGADERREILGALCIVVVHFMEPRLRQSKACRETTWRRAQGGVGWFDLFVLRIAWDISCIQSPWGFAVSLSMYSEWQRRCPPCSLLYCI